LFVPVALTAEVDLLTYGAGAVVVRASKEAEAFGQIALDGSDQTLGIGIPRREPLPLSVVVELPAPSVLRTFEVPAFDDYGTRHGRHVKTVVVEGSTEGPERGFAPLVTLAIRQGVEGPQRFPVADPRAVRWVRLTAVDTHAPAEQDFRPHVFTDISAMGDQEEPAGKGFSGRWRYRRTGLNDTPGVSRIELHRDGDRIVGCEEVGGRRRVVEGEVEGGLARLSRIEADGRRSRLTAVVTSEGELAGVDLGGPPRGFWAGPDTSGGEDLCPLAPDVDPAQQALAAGQEVVLYGIRFDVDSDRLRAEAGPTLERLKGVLEKLPELKVAIEGHTDADASDAHNLDLSRRRAEAVVAWLAERGIARDRLEPVGRGEAEPIADNATSAGRALNRRVEIVPR
ncbi:MAG: OmpA family protein, partial [Myxococcales bacterium]|nr:OmpA family protein [Myxococcales bacterium]